MKIQATNNFVFIKRDESEREIDGLVFPSGSVEKPSKGVIVTIGDVVQDKNIRSGVGKSCIFPKGVGMETEVEGETYLVIEAERVFAIV